MSRTIETRLDRLDTGLPEPPKGCDACRDWPALRVIIGDDPPLKHCPHCSRRPDDHCQTVTISQRSDGPQ
jgi:hypothetical protein